MRIFDYSLVANWDDRLASLADIAERERWTYIAVPDKSPLPVLDGYIRYTFLRLHEQGKLAELDTLVCFNTGLLTPWQEEIFGVFTVADHYDLRQPESSDNKKWFLKTWARSGDRILSPFSVLPDLASYWTNSSDLVFDPSFEVRPNIDHILRENMNRFPTELGGQVDAEGVPQDLVAAPEIDFDEATSDVTEIAAAEAASTKERDVVAPPHSARIALDGAIKHSIRLAQRSYRVAVPQFYHGAIQLLIPLYFRGASRVDLALPLERHDKWYRAATVLYPDWAFRHARLLSRPNSEWLGGFLADVVP
jgi:Domain of unknown function (DUF3825)